MMPTKQTSTPAERATHSIPRDFTFDQANVPFPEGSVSSTFLPRLFIADRSMRRDGSV